MGVGDVLIGRPAGAGGRLQYGVPQGEYIEISSSDDPLERDPLRVRYCLFVPGASEQAGNYEIDLLLVNVCKQNVTNAYEIARLIEDIAGGIMVTILTRG